MSLRPQQELKSLIGEISKKAKNSSHSIYGHEPKDKFEINFTFGGRSCPVSGYLSCTHGGGKLRQAIENDPAIMALGRRMRDLILHLGELPQPNGMDELAFSIQVNSGRVECTSYDLRVTDDVRLGVDDIPPYLLESHASSIDGIPEKTVVQADLWGETTEIEPSEHTVYGFGDLALVFLANLRAITGKPVPRGMTFSVVYHSNPKTNGCSYHCEGPKGAIDRDSVMRATRMTRCLQPGNQTESPHSLFIRSLKILGWRRHRLLSKQGRHQEVDFSDVLGRSHKGTLTLNLDAGQVVGFEHTGLTTARRRHRVNMKSMLRPDPEPQPTKPDELGLDFGPSM